MNHPAPWMQIALSLLFGAGLAALPLYLAHAAARRLRTAPRLPSRYYPWAPTYGFVAGFLTATFLFRLVLEMPKDLSLLPFALLPLFSFSLFIAYTFVLQIYSNSTYYVHLFARRKVVGLFTLLGSGMAGVTYLLAIASVSLEGGVPPSFSTLATRLSLLLLLSTALNYPSARLALWIFRKRLRETEEEFRVFEALAAAWRQAGEDLGIKVQAPYLIRNPESTIVEYVAFLPHYGSPQGALLLFCSPPDYEPDPRALAFAKEREALYSFLNPEVYATYDRDLFVDTLKDYGYFGDGEEKSEWYGDTLSGG